MGFWGTVGSIVGNTVGGGTGNLISQIGNAADTVGQVVGHSADVAAQNRQIQNAQDVTRAGLQTSKDQLALQAKQELANEQAQAANTAIAEEAAKEKQQADAYAKAMQGALGKNIQDVSIDTSQFKTAVPNIHFTGGVRPSAFGQEGRDASAALNNQAMQALLNPPSLPAVPTPTAYQQTQPTVPEPAEAGFWEKLAGPLGFGLTVAGQAAQRNAAPGVTITPNTVGNPTTGVTHSPADIPFAGVPVTPAPTVRPPTPGIDFGPGALNGVTFAPPIPGAVPLSSGPFGGVTFGGG